MCSTPESRSTRARSKGPVARFEACQRGLLGAPRGFAVALHRRQCGQVVDGESKLAGRLNLLVRDAIGGR